MRLANFASLNCSSNSTTTIYLKCLVHYFQIFTILGLDKFSLNLEIPQIITFLPNLIGEPIKAMKHTFDCTFTQENKIPIIYMRVIWSLLIPGIYAICLLIIYYFLLLIKQIKHNPYYIYNGLVYLIIFIQPGMISLLISCISCRAIAGKNYIIADISN